MTQFADFVHVAAGHGPYGYQERLARDGLPDLLQVPTGAGKTLAATLPWLYRRRCHPDAEVRSGTPRRLVFVLPQRALVEQTVAQVARWLAALAEGHPSEGWNEVGLHVLMGGASSDDQAWKLAPEQDAIFVGTQDKVLSRLLMRGYGESRSVWPMSFGLLHADTQFVFDEVQLMGPGLGTSIQLEGMRRAFGTAIASRSMWMSATIDDTHLGGFPDYPSLTTDGRRVELGPEDHVGPLARRLTAQRNVSEIQVQPKRYAQDLAAVVAAEHRQNSRTIVVLNTVDRAVDVYRSIEKTNTGAHVVLLHSRYRPEDRVRHLGAALADPKEAGTIVVTTQVLEAGVNVSSSLLVTELAPWSSIVQRAGRCNREGNDPGAQLLWIRPAGKNAHLPYNEQHLKNAAAQLESLEGLGVTSVQLLEAGVEEQPPLYGVLRRRDLLDLFDTSADLTGNDVDVSRWIRDADERTIDVAWRVLDRKTPTPEEPSPRREELCPVPVGQLRELRTRHAEAGRSGLAHAWIRQQPDNTWTAARAEQLRPGGVVVLDVESGGYTPALGWDRTSLAAVDVIAPAATTPEATEDGDAMGADDLSCSRRPITLTQHLDDVGVAVRELLDAMGPTPQLSDVLRRTAVAAGYLHDLGKAHPQFQASMHRAGAPAEGGPWAKSGGRSHLRHERHHFRHELASALMILDPATRLAEQHPEVDLLAYLVAAHHGKVRLVARAGPGEPSPHLLGITNGDATSEVTMADGRALPSVTLSTASLPVGGGGQTDSWTARACRLRDRADLGPFRLAFLEAVVRSADWAVSRSYDREQR